MVHKKKDGMWLHQAVHSDQHKFDWFIDTLMIWMISMVFSLSLTDLSGADQICNVSAWLLSLTFVCFLYGIAEMKQRLNWFYLGMQILLFMAVLIGQQQIWEGICLLWNQMGDQWTLGNGWVLPELSSGMPYEDKSRCLLYVSVLAGCLIAWICCWLYAHMKSALVILPPAILLAGMVFFDRDRTFQWLLPMLVVSVLMLIDNGKRHSAAAVVISWGLCGIAAFCLISAALLPSMTAWTETFREQIHQKYHERKYETSYTTLPEGNFTEYKDGGKEKYPALSVTMQKPEAMYLRGFTGDIFRENIWRPLDKEALAKNEDLLYWINLNAFHPDAQFHAAASFSKTENNQISIQNIGACSKYYYVPFGLQQGMYLQPDNLNTGGVSGEGQRIYTYLSVADSPKLISQVLDLLQSSEEDSVLEYRKAESAYRGFVYNYYLQISPEELNLLEDAWNQVAARYGSVGSMDVRETQECVIRFLGTCFPEEGTPENMKLPLDEFRGSGYQYATVATLTLRYFGFPARYAEGYVITEDMAKSVEAGGVIEVDSSHATAWVEIYHDGIGWIPMNLTPGMGEMTEEMAGDGSGDGEAAVSESKEGQELEEEEIPEENYTEEPNDGYMTTITKTIQWGFLCFTFLILLLITIMILRRKHILDQRSRVFRTEDRNEAVMCIFKEILILMKLLGLDYGNGSVENLYEPVSRQWGNDSSTTFALVNDLNRLALFSSHKIKEEQRQLALEYYEEILQYLKTEVKWTKRLWIRWIRCLY